MGWTRWEKNRKYKKMEGKMKCRVPFFEHNKPSRKEQGFFGRIGRLENDDVDEDVDKEEDVVGGTEEVAKRI